MKKLLAAVVLASGIAGFSLGEQSKEDARPLRPAAWDDLFLATCTLYQKSYPFGSGVLVGVDIPNRPPETYLLTAIHVVNDVLKHSTNVFRLASADAYGKNTTEIQVVVSRRKCAYFWESDLSAIDITADIMRYIQGGGKFNMQYISVNAPHTGTSTNDDWWCGVVRRGDFAKRGIRVGAPCKWIGSNLWMWRQFADRRESSLCLLDGVISALPQSNSIISSFSSRTKGCPAFVTTIRTIPGMSGGPVFAMGRTDDGQEFPYLIGIGVSKLFSERAHLLRWEQPMETLTNFCAFTNAVTNFEHTENDKGSYVCPLDPFLDFLERTHGLRR